MTPARMAQIHAAGFTQSRPWTAAEFEELLQSRFVFSTPHAHGFALGRVIADECELLTIVTDPDFRRRGYARDLMQRFCQTAFERGAATVFLEVAAQNSGARALYAAFDFRETGLRRGYYARPDGGADDAILMQLDLGSLLKI